MAFDLTEQIACACGCGTFINRWHIGRGFPSDLRERRFVSGHNRPWSGRKRSEATIEKMRLRAQGNRYHWKGGRTLDKDGYVDVRVIDHPNCRKNKYVKEHRLVMERHLGRLLLPSEVVHHIRGKNNNDISNLQLFPSHSEHMKHEWRTGAFANRKRRKS